MEDDTSSTVDMGSGLHTFSVCNRMHGPLMVGRQRSDWLVVSGAVNFGLAGLWTLEHQSFEAAGAAFPVRGSSSVLVSVLSLR